jgi:hypothetical protein
MAVMKKSTRKKLSKQLNKLIKHHGPEMALALVTGIVGALASDRTARATKAKKTKKSKESKAEKAAKPEKAEKSNKASVKVPVRIPAKTVVIRKRS